MKKTYLFLALLLPFFLCGCSDVNFGVQELHSTYLILEGVESSDVTVYCKSDKLSIAEMSECSEVTNEKTIDTLRKNNLIKDEVPVKVFNVAPGRSRISDHKNVDLSFEVKVSNETYSGELNVRTLNTKSESNIDSVDFELETDSGKVLPAMFTFDLHMTI